MNLWQRIWGGGERSERADDEDFDPDVLLTKAQHEMQQLHALNRERAVEAITQKNNLQQMVDDLQKRIDTLQARVAIAEERGDATVAASLRSQLASYVKSLDSARESLGQAIKTSEQVKIAIRREEERIRYRTAEALALQAQWKATQVERSLLASLVEVNAGIGQDVAVSERALRHARNRRLVHQAIVQRNHLRIMRDDTEKRVALLRQNSKVARERDNDALENELLREMEQYEATLAGMREAVYRAEDVTERAIGLLKNEEENLRSLGVDPQSVSDQEAELYEARVALVGVESDGIARRARERRVLWASAAALAVIIALVAIIV